MRLTLPKIYPLTDVSTAALSHLEQVKRLVAGGATLIQLRDKRASPAEFYEAAAAVIKFARPKNIKIIINDRVDIALAVKADGVHLGQNDLPPEKARRILGEKAIIGFSTHNVSQAAAASKLPVDYIAIGPVFATISKANPDPVTGLQTLDKVRQMTGDLPLVAIGGITFENVEAVFQSGADSVAVISSVLNPANKISVNFKRLNQVYC